MGWRAGWVAILASASLVPISSALAAGVDDGQARYARIEHADAIEEGAAAPKAVVHVLFDANCLYCQLTWKALQPYEAAGLRVRWVPVAYQQTSSLGRAAAILGAKDRVAALRTNETGYQLAHYDGGIAPLDTVPADVAARIDDNTRLMRELGAPGTPVLVWRTRDGGWRVRVGMPRLSELPAITGLAEQPQTDPALAPYR